MIVKGFECGPLTRERDECPGEGDVVFLLDKLLRSRSERATLRPRSQPNPTGYAQPKLKEESNG